jgi:hypothetical protein
LSVVDTLRELGLSKAKAAALAREAEKLVDEVLPPRSAKAGRPSAPKRRPKRSRSRSQISDAA